MTRSLFDAESITRTALSGGAETWFDAFWYRAAPDSRHGRIGKAARLLRDRIAATRIRRAGWQIDWGKVFARTAATNPTGSRRI